MDYRRFEAILAFARGPSVSRYRNATWCSHSRYGTACVQTRCCSFLADWTGQTCFYFNSTVRRVSPALPHKTIVMMDQLIKASLPWTVHMTLVLGLPLLLVLERSRRRLCSAVRRTQTWSADIMTR